MTTPSPEPAPEYQADAAGSDATASPSGQDGTEAPDPAEPEHGQEPDADPEDRQAASVINNFYAEVGAHTIGVSASGTYLAKPAIRRESGALAAAEASHALRYYHEPAAFRSALKTLTSQRLVALTGPEGCGKKSGTIALARHVCLTAESYTVLPPTRSLQELASYKGYRPGQVYLIHDWVPVVNDSRSVASYDLEQLTAQLDAAKAFMAITFESASHLQVLLGGLCISWSAPEPAELMRHCIGKIPDLQCTDEESKLMQSRAKEIHYPRLIVSLAESALSSGVEQALAEAGETENTAIKAWFDQDPARWKVWSVTALTFLSGVGERKFERLLTALTEINPVIKSATTAETRRGDEAYDPADTNEPFPQSRWKLANDASLEAFISERNLAAPIGSEHRPAFRTKACRLHFMMELNVRYGDELWSPVRDWIFTMADQPFGEAQIAAGYGLALLSRCALEEVAATYLAPWSAGNLRNRLMAVNVLWAMAEDDLCAPAALRIAVNWVRNRGQERAITAALAFGGPLGERYPSEAMRWLWVLSLRGERIGRVARTALSQLFAVEAESSQKKSTVLRFLLPKIRKIVRRDALKLERSNAIVLRERRAALAVVNSVLGTKQAYSEVPVVVSVVRTRQAECGPIGELWAAVLNSVPHRLQAIRALHSTLTALSDSANPEELAAQLGVAILPRLTDRSLEVLERILPDPDRAEKISASVVAAFLGAQQQAIGKRNGSSHKGTV